MSKKERIPWKQEDLEKIYDAYPRKVAKQAALKAIGKALDRLWEKAVNGAVPNLYVRYLAERTTLYANSQEGKKRDREFIPHPSTWFNAGRYDDDEREWNVVHRSEPEKKIEREAEAKAVVERQYEAQRTHRNAELEAANRKREENLALLRGLSPERLNELIVRAKGSIPGWAAATIKEWDIEKSNTLRAWVLRELNR